VPSAKRIVGGVVLAVIALYAADYFSARWRGANALGAVQVQPYYAVPLKDGKTEYMMLDPETRTCVKSVAPHFGYSPCWYLQGHKQQRTNM
jgi:hypothetical protein